MVIYMLIIEKLKKTKFSSSEKVLVDYILTKKETIRDKTTKEISAETYTSPSTLIRIAKKVGYSGWNELKENYLKEILYLDSHFKEVDANFPFLKNDSIMSIANKIAILNKETIDDTLSLINREELQKAINIIKNSFSINLFASSINLIISEDFKYKMARINKKVEICSIEGEQMFAVHNCTPDSCAIVISYSGESNLIVQITETLKSLKVPIIVITGVGNNTLSKHSDSILNISTREKLYSKIANFSINDSICYILDVLYSCTFSLNYDENLRYKIETSKRIDPRFSSLDIISED